MSDQHNLNFSIPANALDQLFIELGLENLSDEEKVQLTTKITTLLKNKLTIRIVEQVPADKIEELTNLSEEDTIAMLAQYGIDLEALIIEESLLLRQDLLDSASYMKGFIDGLSQQ